MYVCVRVCVLACERDPTTCSECKYDKEVSLTTNLSSSTNTTLLSSKLQAEECIGRSIRCSDQSRGVPCGIQYSRINCRP